MQFTRWVRKHERTVLVVLAVALLATLGSGSGIYQVFGRGVSRLFGATVGRLFGGGDGGGEPESTARMFGEAVSPDQFGRFWSRWARFPFAADNMEEAWSAYAAVQLAERLGVRVSDGELKAVVWSTRVFFDDPRSPEGRFSAEQYEAVLRRFRMGKLEFEETMREYLATFKLRSLLLDSALVTSAEVWPWYRDTHLSYRTAAVRYAVEDCLSQVAEPTEEELRTSFEAEKDPRYREPERIQVEVLAAPYQPFHDDVDVSEEEARAYYDSHQERFPGAPAPQEGAEGGEATPPSVRPFDEVREEIRELLRTRGARQKAEAALSDARKQLAAEPETTFEAVAQASGGKLQTATSGFFAAGELPDVPLLGESLDPSSPLVSSLFDLDEGKLELSRALPGKDATVLCRLLGRQPSRVPSLDEVKDRVVSDFKRQRAAELAADTAAELADELTEEKLSLTSDGVRERGLEIEVSPWYTADDEDAPAFARKLRARQAGDIAVEKTEDAVYVVEVLETRPPSKAEFEADRKLVKQRVDRFNRQGLLPALWDAIVRRETGLELPEVPPEERAAESEEQPTEEPPPVPATSSAPGVSAEAPGAEEPADPAPALDAGPGSP